MADLKAFVRIHSNDFDTSKLQDAIIEYILSLEAKIAELEARLEAGGH